MWMLEGNSDAQSFDLLHFETQRAGARVWLTFPSTRSPACHVRSQERPPLQTFWPVLAPKTRCWHQSRGSSESRPWGRLKGCELCSGQIPPPHPQTWSLSPPVPSRPPSASAVAWFRWRCCSLAGNLHHYRGAQILPVTWVKTLDMTVHSDIREMTESDPVPTEKKATSFLKLIYFSPRCKRCSEYRCIEPGYRSCIRSN